MKNYYANELTKLLVPTGDDKTFSVQIFDGIGNRTKTLNINSESADLLIQFIREVSKQ